eukprot:scaffold1505_cov243-Alexandrium_tamarense.AAC.1
MPKNLWEVPNRLSDVERMLDVDVLKLIIEGSQRLPVEGSVCVVHHSIVQYLHRSSDFYLTEAMDRWTSITSTITSTITSKRFEYLI